MIGRPSVEDYVRYVEGNMILNYPITREDIIRTEDILGSNLGSIKGKMTRRHTQHVQLKWLHMTQDKLDNHRNYGNKQNYICNYNLMEQTLRDSRTNM